jgi:hypothetical protein
VVPGFRTIRGKLREEPTASDEVAGRMKLEQQGFTNRKCFEGCCRRWPPKVDLLYVLFLCVQPEPIVVGYRNKQPHGKCIVAPITSRIAPCYSASTLAPSHALLVGEPEPDIQARSKVVTSGLRSGTPTQRAIRSMKRCAKCLLATSSSHL